MTNLLTKTETEIDEALADEVASAISVVSSDWTLADALREGAKSISQVRESFGVNESTGCAITAITVAAASHNVEI